MKEKINIAELLKDCPKGMELDCTMYENVEFDYIEQSYESIYPIRCLMKTNGGYNSLFFTYNGCSDIHPNAKCVIFPKGKTTWEGFHRPFKDGDVVAVTMNPEGIWTGIFKQNKETSFESHCYLNTIGEFNSKGLKNHSLIGLRFATEEEKQKLFDTIKVNGYKWNAETKTLEKLVEPKFKVGDKVKDKNNRVWFIVYVSETFFDISSVPDRLDGSDLSGYFVPIEDQDDYELFLDKEYPKTYEECCKVLMGKTDFQDFELVLTKLSINRSEENSISPEPPYISLINTFYKLLICRDAYWKLYGEEMGLGKSWEPDYRYKDTWYSIYYNGFSIIQANTFEAHTFIFPTEEMRDAFKENFKEEIEICKEFL